MFHLGFTMQDKKHDDIFCLFICFDCFLMLALTQPLVPEDIH